jgi:LDH2 family malate/lactate/ureidoglycolate dehydrogenase
VLSVFLQELRQAKRVHENVPIHALGEKEMLAKERNLKEGMEVDISTVAEMLNVCEYLGMDKEAYFRKVDVSSAKTGTYEKIYQ